jgi:SAM-dependent methyltransferase
MKTYTSVRPGIRGLVGDAKRLYQIRASSIAADVDVTMVQRNELDHACQHLMGKALRGQRILVIGAGQTGREVMAFGVDNDVTAIDLDAIPQGFDVRSYITLLRENGVVRTGKTVARKALGIDRKFERVMRERLGVDALRKGTYLQMDATKMSFADNSFDVVYSFSVFEHLPDPEAVLNEAKRVLRPGGVMSISWHIYTSEGGCHDLRIFAGDRATVPYWAQLRPPQKHLVIESCYMNEWRLARIKELHARSCPGTEFETDQHHEPYGSFLSEELARLRAAGELADYADEEVLSVNLLARWCKPTA